MYSKGLLKYSHDNCAIVLFGASASYSSIPFHEFVPAALFRARNSICKDSLISSVGADRKLSQFCR
jgi:hypothetical protein